MRQLCIFAFCMLLKSVFLPSQLLGQQQLKVLSYNVLEGFQGDSTIQQSYVDWVRGISPDIVAYQEMNGFTQKKLEEFAARHGHSYAVLAKVEGFPVALTARFPIVNVAKVLDNMWHGYIYANINGMHVFVIHFSPFSYKKRQAEVSEIIAHTKLIPKEQPIMVMGDFNSLSRDDQQAYDSTFLQSRIEAERKRAIVRNLNQGQLDFSVTDALREAGFEDVAKMFTKDFTVSAPTMKYRKETKQRIDYLWVNEKLVPAVRSGRYIYDNVTDNISDHYPIVVEFELKEK